MTKTHTFSRIQKISDGFLIASLPLVAIVTRRDVGATPYVI